MDVTSENYYTPEANMEYMSVSQLKSFRECEARGLAEATGEYQRPTSKAFLEGGYVDAHFAGEMDKFLSEHPEILNSRTGALKSEFVKARAAIERAEHDEMFMHYVSGKPQKVLTGEMFGVPWKAKPDFVHPDMIVDLKYMKDIQPIWKDGEKKTFIDAYGYDLQGYVYQTLEYQLTGLMKPFYLAVITKEDPADLHIINIPQWRLNACQEVIKYYSRHFTQIKQGASEPVRCENCAYCRSTKVLKHVTNYEDLLDM